MKKNYNSPEVNVVKFDTENIMDVSTVIATEPASMQGATQVADQKITIFD